MPLPVGQVRMRMVGAEYGADLRGPTTCQVIDQGGVDDVLARLGPDPLRRDADPAPAWARISKSHRLIGALLMDQVVIAGIGNVYRNELLFRHGIDPHRPGTHVDAAEFDEAWTDLVELMKVGVRRGRIITVRPVHDHGAPSYAPNRPRTYVYRRAGEACRVCGTPIRTEVMEARNLFWCPTCQT
jgi:endonuclease-8